MNSDGAVISVGDYGRCASNSDAQHIVFLYAQTYILRFVASM